MTGYRIDDGLVGEQNAALAADLAADYEHLGAKLARAGVGIEAITAAAAPAEMIPAPSRNTRGA